MTTLTVLASVMAGMVYLAGAAVGWRIGYVHGYEGSVRAYGNGRGGLSHGSHHFSGLFRGLSYSAVWPITLTILGLYGLFMHFTPTPPSRQKELLEEREREITRIERELGLTTPRYDPNPRPSLWADFPATRYQDTHHPDCECPRCIPGVGG